MPRTVRTYQGVIEGYPSLSVSIFGHAPAATPTDLFTILGSATAVVRLSRLLITGRATAATWYRLRLLKYSSIYTGGTGVAQTLTPHDSDDAATAVVKTWAGGLPTVGTLVGAIRDDDIPLQAAALTATQPFTGPPGLLYDFSKMGSRRPTLRGIGEYLAINGNGAALPAGTALDITAELTEE